MLRGGGGGVPLCKVLAVPFSPLLIAATPNKGIGRCFWMGGGAPVSNCYKNNRKYVTHSTARTFTSDSASSSKNKL